MKKFILFLAVLGGFIWWVKGWVASGQMDALLMEKKQSKYTPVILKGMAEICFFAQQFKPASYYYRWVVEEYPNDPSVPKLRWQLGQSYEELHRRDLALDQYAVLKDTYSNTQYGRIASNRYQQIKY